MEKSEIIPTMSTGRDLMRRVKCTLSQQTVFVKQYFKSQQPYTRFDVCLSIGKYF